MKYFLIAGEASGDLHASNLMHELKKLDNSAEFCYFGGDLMQTQGGNLVKHYREMAFMGFWAVIKNARKVLMNLTDCKKAIYQFQPDVVILIDYPGFNLRIAKFVKEKFQTPVYYYISPKIWAWKEYRIKEIKLYIDKMFTIFPFETEFYAKHNYNVEYVGNPTVDSVEFRKKKLQTFEQFITDNKLSEKPIIALLAGSRKQEIAACLPRMIEATTHFNDFQAIIAGAPGIDTEYYSTLMKGKKIDVVFGQTYQLLQNSKVAIVNSGTATLETALLNTPQVVIYHVLFGPIAYKLKDYILKTKYISLVNIIAYKEVVKELVAHLFTVENVVNEVKRIISNDNYRHNMLEEYSNIKQKLGEAGTAQRTANKIIGFLKMKNEKIIF